MKIDLMRTIVAKPIYVIHSKLYIALTKAQFSIGVSALIMLLIVATTIPYKKMYMNHNMDSYSLTLLSCSAIFYNGM